MPRSAMTESSREGAPPPAAAPAPAPAPAPAAAEAAASAAPPASASRACFALNRRTSATIARACFSRELMSEKASSTMARSVASLLACACRRPPMPSSISFARFGAGSAVSFTQERSERDDRSLARKALAKAAPAWKLSMISARRLGAAAAAAAPSSPAGGSSTSDSTTFADLNHDASMKRTSFTSSSGQAVDSAGLELCKNKTLWVVTTASPPRRSMTLSPLT
mmetsp:Transcript_7477/g.29817  ORF Transcript_7477/g.29817 Transcript_7477/m.29817 type:complete len:224 (-) Transcript_7477:756-1427(-)